ncbi:MAG: TIGR03668 family PPOX class F420-dependent oxidoreductase [Acidimicrobiia bacterium]
MDREEAWARLGAARVGHIATVRPDGSPHIVVVTFATVGRIIVTAIDHKPKTTKRLQRLVNIEANPEVSLMADHYDEDWDRLWWVRVDGHAEIHENQDAPPGSMAALVAKYPQYVARPPIGPVIAITPQGGVSWESST